MTVLNQRKRISAEDNTIVKNIEMTLAENNDIVLKFYKQNYIDELSEEAISTFNIPLGEYYKKSYIDDSFYTKAELDTKFDSLVGFTVSIVSELPSTGENGVIYLVPSADGETGNIYIEYIWVDNKFEKIGDTATKVNLTDYYTKTQVDAQISTQLQNYHLGPFRDELINKANTDHTHTSEDIDIDESGNDSLWIDEYGVNRQSLINCIVYDHEKKLENIDDGANKTVVDSSLSSSSKNPVQNKVVNSALSGKSDIGHEHTSDEIHYAYDQNVSVTTILENKAPKYHTHDDRYYTEAEIDEKLNGKADSNHRHNDVSILKQVDNDWVGLPVWYMIKNGWCILQWEDPIIYLKSNNVSIPTGSWFKLGNVPVPQTGRPVYQQLTTGNEHIRISITSGGVLQSYMTGNNVWSYGTLVYPTKNTS